MEEQLVEYSLRLGERLEKVIRPLVSKGEGTRREQEAAREFLEYSRGLAERIAGMLDPIRDLAESSVLVLENGTGLLARRLAEGGADVVAVAPTRELSRTAKKLDPYPSVLYRWFDPFPTTEEFDIIVGTGLLAFYPREVTLALLEGLAGFCRRKLILELPLRRSWPLRLFVKPRNPGGLQLTSFGAAEIFDLVETSCGMLISEHRDDEGRLLFKALRKAHRNRPAP